MRDDMHFLSSEQVRAIADQRSPHTVAASEVVWSGRIVDMVEDRVVVVEGEEPVVRQYTRHPGAVAVVVMRGEEGAEEILLERQYRHPVNASLWEIPAGLLDIPGEDPLVAAERELAEEADLAARRSPCAFSWPVTSKRPARRLSVRTRKRRWNTRGWRCPRRSTGCWPGACTTRRRSSASSRHTRHEAVVGRG